MPMIRSERICGACSYFQKDADSEVFGTCHKVPVIVAKITSDWCSEGWWEKYSSITDTTVDYEYTDETIGYDEKRVQDKQNKMYVVVSWIDGEALCEVFETKAKAQYYMDDLKVGIIRLFETYWETTLDYWNTKIVI
jgi:hypothetical protein